MERSNAPRSLSKPIIGVLIMTENIYTSQQTENQEDYSQAYVYMNKRISTGEIYIGVHCGDPQNHEKYWGSGTLFQNKFKYTSDDWTYEIVATGPRTYMDDIEALLVPEYNIHENNKKYLNLKTGGTSGSKHSKETIKRMSDAKSGENHPLYGTSPSEETRKKIAKSNSGRKQTDEHKRKVSEALKGEKNPNYGKSPPDKTRKKMSESAKNRYYSEEYKKKISESLKEYYRNTDRTERARKRKIASSNNTSGYTGVTFNKRVKKWRATIYVGRLISLGYFHDKEDAIQARKDAEIKYYSMDQIPEKENNNLRCDNTSGYTGVRWSKKENKWVVDITKDKKRIYLGGFHDKQNAIIARKAAEEKYYNLK